MTQHRRGDTSLAVMGSGMSGARRSSTIQTAATHKPLSVRHSQRHWIRLREADNAPRKRRVADCHFGRHGRLHGAKQCWGGGQKRVWLWLYAGYDEPPGSIYGYGGPSYAIVGGYGGGTGWYRGGDSDWRQRAWRKGAVNPQQAERLLQEQRNAALLRQQMLQNQAIIQENRMRSIQQVQEARMRSLQQAQEARAAWQRKALGQQ